MSLDLGLYNWASIKPIRPQLGRHGLASMLNYEVFDCLNLKTHSLLLNKSDDNCESSIIFNYKITLSSIYVYRGMIILVNLFVWIRQILVSIKMMGESIIFKSKEIKHFYLNNMVSIRITCFLFLVSSWRWKIFSSFPWRKAQFPHVP